MSSAILTTKYLQLGSPTSRQFDLISDLSKCVLEWLSFQSVRRQKNEFASLVRKALEGHRLVLSKGTIAAFVWRF
jgi:hypothetical protein